MERRGFLMAGAWLLPAALHVQARARSWDFYLTRLAYESGDWEHAPGMAASVLGALDASSSLRVDPRERVALLSDARMLAAPFCYLGGARLVQFNPAERRNLERYLRGGGFLLAEGSGALFARSFGAEMARLFGPRALQPLPAQHALYSSFHRLDGAQHEHALQALVQGGRIRVLHGAAGYARQWEQGAAGSLRLAVNIIHYALGA